MWDPYLSVAADRIHVQTVLVEEASDNRVRMPTEKIRPEVLVQIDSVDLGRAVLRADHQNPRVWRPINPGHIIVRSEEVATQHETVVFSGNLAGRLEDKNYAERRNGTQLECYLRRTWFSTNPCFPWPLQSTSRPDWTWRIAQHCWTCTYGWRCGRSCWSSGLRPSHWPPPWDIHSEKCRWPCSWICFPAKGSWQCFYLILKYLFFLFISII